MRAAQGTIPTNNDQPIHPCFVHPPDRFALSLRVFETFTAPRLQNRAAALDNPSDIPGTHGSKFTIQQTFVSIKNPQYINIVCHCRSNHGPYGCIHSWCITSGGEHSYC